MKAVHQHPGNGTTAMTDWKVGDKFTLPKEAADSGWYRVVFEATRVDGELLITKDPVDGSTLGFYRFRCEPWTEPPTEEEIKASKSSLKDIERELDVPVWEYRIWADPQAIAERDDPKFGYIWSWEARCEALNWHKRSDALMQWEAAQTMVQSAIKSRSTRRRRKEARRTTPWRIHE